MKKLKVCTTLLLACFLAFSATAQTPVDVQKANDAKIKSDEETYLKFEGIATREAAMKLVQKIDWITEQDFKKFAAKTSPAGLLGYTIIDSATSLGEITEVIEQPHQLLIKLLINNKEALIPLHEDFVKK